MRHLSAQPVNQPDAGNNLRFVFSAGSGAGYFSALCVRSRRSTFSIISAVFNSFFVLHFGQNEIADFPCLYCTESNTWSQLSLLHFLGFV
jgi:hypothetical protein